MTDVGFSCEWLMLLTGFAENQKALNLEIIFHLHVHVEKPTLLAMVRTIREGESFTTAWTIWPQFSFSFLAQNISICRNVFGVKRPKHASNIPGKICQIVHCRIWDIIIVGVREIFFIIFHLIFGIFRLSKSNRPQFFRLQNFPKTLHFLKFLTIFFLEFVL